MSKNESAFVKILFVVFCLGLIQFASGCIKNEGFEIHNPNLSTPPVYSIINGEKVLATDNLATKALYLSIGSKLFKTPQGISAEQKSFCSAVAIHPLVVLTAAHCVANHTNEEINIILGLAPWQGELNPKLWQKVDQIIIHKNYIQNSPHFDIALLKLGMPLPSHLVVDALEISSDLGEKESIVVAGYGHRIEIKNGSQDLMFSGELYALVLPAPKIDRQKTIFLMPESSHKVCLGDSGAPAFHLNIETNRIELLGLLSGSIATAQEQDYCRGEMIFANLKSPEINLWLQENLIQLLEPMTR